MNQCDTFTPDEWAAHVAAERSAGYDRAVANLRDGPGGAQTEIAAVLVDASYGGKDVTPGLARYLAGIAAKAAADYLDATKETTL